jgi:hypothetical protein
MDLVTSTIYPFRVDLSKGTLTRLDPVNGTPTGGTRDLAIAPSSPTPVAAAATDSLSFAIDTTTGALTPGSTVAAGSSSRLSIDPLARFLYAQGQLNEAPSAGRRSGCCRTPSTGPRVR